MRSISPSALAARTTMLMVDDVAYEAKALGEKYTIAGYNVYRNGERINDSLILPPRISTPTRQTAKTPMW